MMEATTEKITVSGTLIKTIYNKDNYVIGIISAPDNDLANHFGEIKIKGNMIAAQTGLEYKLVGEMVQDRTWGPSFVFSEYESIYPTETAAIELYLKESCPGVGPSLARRITEKFGKDTLDVCKNSPESLEEIKGISQAKAREIAETLTGNERLEQVAVEIRRLFEGTKISKFVRNNMIVTHQSKTIDVIKKNPYILTEFRGVGFHKADKVAEKLDFRKDHPFRISAGLIHILQEAAGNEGHTYLSLQTLLDRGVELLSVDVGECNRVVARMKASDEIREELGGISLDDCKVALTSFFLQESFIAEKIHAMLTADVKLPDNTTIDFSDLAEDQHKAVNAAISHNIFILTGAPGTGKTYTVEKILSLFRGSRKALAAPTGKAAARLSELSGYPASTIHRLLGPMMVDGKFIFSHDQNNPLPYQVVVIDEASMMDVTLTKSLTAGMPTDSRLILVGDTNQLPAVGPGNVLKDLLKYGVPSVELTTIKRQNPGMIVKNCHSIKAGNEEIKFNNDPTSESDFFFIRCPDQDKIKHHIVGMCNPNRIAKHFGVNPLKQVQVLSPTKEKTDLSCKSLNTELQKTLNGENQSDKHFWTGDKVIQTRNDYELGIINGDIGYIRKIDAKKIFVTFENPTREVAINKKGNDLQLAYCLTVHKYQGSECPVVVIPIHRAFGTKILQRNWLYTAISRASKAIVMVGQIDEIAKIIKRNEQVKRLTNLYDLLVRKEKTNVEKLPSLQQEN